MNNLCILLLGSNRIQGAVKLERLELHTSPRHERYGAFILRCVLQMCFDHGADCVRVPAATRAQRHCDMYTTTGFSKDTSGGLEYSFLVPHKENCHETDGSESMSQTDEESPVSQLHFSSVLDSPGPASSTSSARSPHA